MIGLSEKSAVQPLLVKATVTRFYVLFYRCENTYLEGACSCQRDSDIL